MGHTPLVPPFPFPMLLCHGFLVQNLSNFKAKIVREREKDAEHNMLMLIQFTHVLLS